MKKGKNPTLIVLAVEIASIIILHAVKINQTEKATGKEITRNSPVRTDNKAELKDNSMYSLAVFR